MSTIWDYWFFIFSHTCYHKDSKSHFWYWRILKSQSVANVEYFFSFLLISDGFYTLTLFVLNIYRQRLSQTNSRLVSLPFSHTTRIANSKTLIYADTSKQTHTNKYKPHTKRENLLYMIDIRSLVKVRHRSFMSWQFFSEKRCVVPSMPFHRWS